MSYFRKILEFCNSNSTFITLAGVIVAVHWGWYKIQDVPYLVSPSEKKDLPIVRGAKKLNELIGEKINEWKGNKDEVEDAKKT